MKSVAIKILPHVIRTEPKQEQKEKPFISLIQKPKPKTNNRENRLFFITT
jgi:hypothetical protein